MLTVTDLFSGAGGSSTGMKEAGYTIGVAVNHWPTAVETHQANHPEAAHDCADISQVDPKRYPRTDVAWMSPSCTHHSRAQGRRKTSGPGLFDKQPNTLGELVEMEPDRSRATMFDVIRFTEHHRYEAVIVENVPEVLDWPLFPYWLGMMQELGYHYRPVLLNAADANRSGAAVAQSRLRAYLIFSRNTVTLPTWGTGQRLGAAAFLDADPGRAMSSRRYADATVRRVEATVERYPDADRWIVSYYGASKVGKPATEPVGTLTTRDRHAVVTRVGGELYYRMVSLAEQKRLMGFPANYIWRGTARDVTAMIGNAVVPAAARDVGSVVLDSLGVAA